MKHLHDVMKSFPDEQSCIDYLELKRWNGFPVSPFDPSSKVYKCKDEKYRCRNTKKYFNVKTGTIFYNSKIPLTKWFEAILLLGSSEKQWNSVSLATELGLTQKSTWYLMHKLGRHTGLRPVKKFDGSSENDNQDYKLADWLKTLTL